MKHGINFAVAAEVLLSPFTQFVDASVPEEEREAAIGPTLDFTMLYVVHVVRDSNLIRRISARNITTKERKLYEDGK